MEYGWGTRNLALTANFFERNFHCLSYCTIYQTDSRIPPNLCVCHNIIFCCGQLLIPQNVVRSQNYVHRHPTTPTEEDTRGLSRHIKFVIDDYLSRQIYVHCATEMGRTLWTRMGNQLFEREIVDPRKWNTFGWLTPNICVEKNIHDVHRNASLIVCN